MGEITTALVAGWGMGMLSAVALHYLMVEKPWPMNLLRARRRCKLTRQDVCIKCHSRPPGPNLLCPPCNDAMRRQFIREMGKAPSSQDTAPSGDGRAGKGTSSKMYYHVRLQAGEDGIPTATSPAHSFILNPGDELWAQLTSTIQPTRTTWARLWPGGATPSSTPEAPAGGQAAGGREQRLD